MMNLVLFAFHLTLTAICLNLLSANLAVYVTHARVQAMKLPYAYQLVYHYFSVSNDVIANVEATIATITERLKHLTLALANNY